MVISFYIKTYKLSLFSLEMEFIALLSSGEGSWAQVAGLIKQGEWDKIILVGDDFASKFKCEKQYEFINVKMNQPIAILKDVLLDKLKGKLSGMEVALTIASGTGKEHMALISALLSIPVGVKFVALTKDGIIEL
jgi:hypothetical protein